MNDIFLRWFFLGFLVAMVALSWLDEIEKRKFYSTSKGFKIFLELEKTKRLKITKKRYDCSKLGCKRK